jgi:YgiT-type zinc finger domain-containing protein
MKEKMIETEVTYTLNLGGKFYIIEHVPARVCWETGEQLFSPRDRGAHPSLDQGGEEARQSDRDPRLRIRMNGNHVPFVQTRHNVEQILVEILSCGIDG